MRVACLALLLVTGLFMTVYGKLGFGRGRWLTVHQIIGAVIILNAVFIMVPVGGDHLALVSEIDRGNQSMDVFNALKTREAIFGAVNVLLALFSIFIATLKPRLGQIATAR